MNTNKLPLPLELTQPVLLAGDLDTQVQAGLGTGDYDPRTQLRGGHRGGGTRSNQECKSYSGLLVIDVTVDLQIDDNDVF